MKVTYRMKNLILLRGNMKNLILLRGIMKNLILLGFMIALAGCSMWGEVGVKTYKKEKMCYKMKGDKKVAYSCKKYER
jgi:hypothetical protein